MLEAATLCPRSSRARETLTHEAVTLPLHYRYITITLSLIAVTLPLQVAKGERDIDTWEDLLLLARKLYVRTEHSARFMSSSSPLYVRAELEPSCFRHGEGRVRVRVGRVRAG